MKNVLVSGASGIVGYGILRSLRMAKMNLKLVGTTIYEDSVAQGFCDVFERALPTKDPEYMNWLCHILDKHQIDIIIPGIEDDLYKWVEFKNEIESRGSRVLTNNSELVTLCKDKWQFYQKMMEINSPVVIPSSVENNFEVLADAFKLPFLLKPKRGFGSKGIVKVDNLEIFNMHKDDIGTILLAQPIVGNQEEEFTTSAFCDGQGGFYAKMTMRRKLSKDGYTDRAETYELEGVDVALKHLCSHFKPVGPTNFQFRRHDGRLKLLEINPRISSSTSIRAAFGYNESEMVINYYLENKIPVQPEIRKGKAVRYTEDFIFYEDRNHL